MRDWLTTKPTRESTIRSNGIVLRTEERAGLRMYLEAPEGTAAIHVTAPDVAAVYVNRREFMFAGSEPCAVCDVTTGAVVEFLDDLGNDRSKIVQHLVDRAVKRAIRRSRPRWISILLSYFRYGSSLGS